MARDSAGVSRPEVESGQTIPDLLNERVVELVGEKQALVDDQVIETHAESRNRLAVERDHAEAEGDGEKQRGKLIEVKRRAVPAAGGSERRLDAEPDDQDHGESAVHVGAHRLKERGMLGHELREKGKKIVHRTGRHQGSSLRHSPIQHGGAGIRGLCGHDGLGLRHELNVIIDRRGFGVARCVWLQ